MQAIKRRARHISVFNELIGEEQSLIVPNDYVLAEEFFASAIAPALNRDPKFSSIFDSSNKLDEAGFRGMAEEYAMFRPETASKLRYHQLGPESQRIIDASVARAVRRDCDLYDPAAYQGVSNRYFWNGPGVSRNPVPFDKLKDDQGRLDAGKLLKTYKEHPFGLYQKIDLLAILARSGQGVVVSGLDKYVYTMFAGNGKNVLSFYKAVNGLTTYSRCMSNDDEPPSSKGRFVGMIPSGAATVRGFMPIPVRS